MNRRSSKRTSHLLNKRFLAGTSIVEAVLVIALGSVLTGIVVTGLAALMQYDHRQTANTVTREQLQALITMLRGDARQSTSYQLDVEDQSLQFLQPGQQMVKYQFHEGDCQRTQIAQTLEEQTMRLRAPTDLKFSSDSPRGKQGDLLRIQFDTLSTSATHENNRSLPNWQLELVAQIGRDYITQALSNP